MHPSAFVAPLALMSLPLWCPAQAGQPAAATGLEIPTPTLPNQGYFLTGAYVSGFYSSRLAGGGAGYAGQSYRRYFPGAAGRARPFSQHRFSSFWVRPAYAGAAGPFGPGGELPATLVSAPLRPSDRPCGGLGAFSVGIPLRHGPRSVLLNQGGSVLGELLLNVLR